MNKDNANEILETNCLNDMGNAGITFIPVKTVNIAFAIVENTGDKDFTFGNKAFHYCNDKKI